MGKVKIAHYENKMEGGYGHSPLNFIAFRRRIGQMVSLLGSRSKLDLFLHKVRYKVLAIDDRN